jgi:hypothetical protein
MPAPKGNKYAERITREDALEIANKALSLIDDDCYSLSEVAEKCETYRTKFDYLLRKFNGDQEVFDTIKRMGNKCESILARKALEGKVNPSVGIFILKSYHGLIETSRLQKEIGDEENPIRTTIEFNGTEIEI